MMSELSAQKLQPKKDWALTSGAFQHLLDWLDESRDSGGEKYLEMRRRLVTYFDRKNCLTPDDLADETLNRVARRLEEEAIVTESPAKYCYNVARFVFMEHLREMQNDNAILDQVRHQSHGSHPPASETDEQQSKEEVLNCLEQCRSTLEPLSREIITRYYTGKERIKIENRRVLAEELKVTVNALRIRACRIRDRLEECVRQCVDTK